MKKETMLSALSLTAALVTPLSYPVAVLANPPKAEKKFAEEFALRSATPVRYTTAEGEKILGRVYFILYQYPVTPSELNQLKAEMSGQLYFQSDEKIKQSEEGPYEMSIDLAGEEGHVLVDLIDDQYGRTYQVYGCSTTLNSCRPESYKVIFDGRKVEFYMALPENFEALEVVTEHVNGELKQVEKWDREAWTKMSEIPMPK